ncbi:MAG: formyltransferase family protein, partial [Prevotella sp.]
MTVHWISKEIDGGEIIAQFSTPILPSDTVEDIAAKEHLLEMEHFPEVIEKTLEQL